MNYQKFLKTKSKTAVREYEKVLDKNAELAGQLADLSRGDNWDREALEKKIEVMQSDMKIKREENHALQLRIDAQSTAIDGIENHNSMLQEIIDRKDEELADIEAEKSNLKGKIDGLESAIKLFTRERGE